MLRFAQVVGALRIVRFAQAAPVGWARVEGLGGVENLMKPHVAESAEPQRHAQVCSGCGATSEAQVCSGCARRGVGMKRLSMPASGWDRRGVGRVAIDFDPFE